jgi:hypothetical protein
MGRLLLFGGVKREPEKRERSVSDMGKRGKMDYKIKEGDA